MKKILSALLCLLMLASLLAGCGTDKPVDNTTPTGSTEVSAATSTSTDANSAEAAVQLYMDNKDVWEIKQDADSVSWYGYLFLDLDFDGTLELIAAQNGGTETRSDNKFYKLDKENNSVVELAFPDKDEDQWDFTGGDYPKVYRNNETKELKYMVYDHIRGGDASFAMRIGELTLGENSEVVSKNLWGFKYTMADASDSGMEENVFQIYDADGVVTNTDEDTYNNTLNAYELNNTVLELTFDVVEGFASDYTYAELTEAEQQELLLAGYKAFSYK